MKKILIGLCAISLCLLTACFEFCGITNGDAKTTYTYSYIDADGKTQTGEFTADQYGYGSFNTTISVDCSKVTINKKGDQKDLPLDEPVA